jgi:hypothetical protein
LKSVIVFLISLLLSLSSAFAEVTDALEAAIKHCQEDIFYGSGTITRRACVVGAKISKNLADSISDPQEIYFHARKECKYRYTGELRSRIGCVEGVYYYFMTSNLIKDYSNECLEQGEVTHLDACLDGAYRAQLANFIYPENKNQMQTQADDGGCFRDYGGLSTSGPKYADCFIGILQVYLEKGFVDLSLTSLIGFRDLDRPSWLTYRYSPWHAKYR